MHTWTEQPGPLPTLPGKSPGIVAYWKRTPDSSPRATVQCSACYRTLTDDLRRAVHACKFDPDPGETGWSKYRRCEYCVASRRPPRAG